MTHPSLCLKRWNPLNLACNQPTGNTTVTFDKQPPNETLLVDIDPSMASHRNLATLYRAAQINDLLDTLFETDFRLQGQPWYDRLPRIIAMNTEALVDREKMTFTWTSGTSWKDHPIREIMTALSNGETNAEEVDAPADLETFEIGENAVAEYIVVQILVQTEYEVLRRRLRTDFGVGTEQTTSAHDAGILIAPDCTLGVEALKNLIAEAVFECSRDEKEDSHFLEEAHTAAARLLLDEPEATAESIRYMARTHLRHLLPDQGAVQLRKKPVPGTDDCDVEVRILPDQGNH
ncbi:MAG: hypothetical protein OXG04_18615 [Acidobacteria bacterium]|nr:hypothetical protein [Acidobacteriota bacterium]